ncbi:hypothetical protein FKP32DRAFT_1679507 [Trametes sanguinea]|nr:hypothetical protein FKP32DRAFT_1679507 [Trametes sanguinea]
MAAISDPILGHHDSSAPCNYQYICENFASPLNSPEPSSPTSCSKCSMPFVQLTPDSTVWCACTLQTTDRELLELRACLNATADRVGELESQLLDEKDICDKLHQEVRRGRERSKADQAAVLELEEKLAEYAKEREEDARRQRARYRAMEDEYGALRQEHTALYDNMRDVEADREILRATRDASRLELEASAKNLQSRISYLESENESLTSETAYFRDRCSDLGTQLEDTTAELVTAKTKYINLEWKSDEDIGNLLAEQREREAEILGLKQLLETSTQCPRKLVDACLQTDARPLLFPEGMYAKTDEAASSRSLEDGFEDLDAETEHAASRALIAFAQQSPSSADLAHSPLIQPLGTAVNLSRTLTSFTALAAANQYPERVVAIERSLITSPPSDAITSEAPHATRSSSLSNVLVVVSLRTWLPSMPRMLKATLATHFALLTQASVRVLGRGRQPYHLLPALDFPNLAFASLPVGPRRRYGDMIIPYRLRSGSLSMAAGRLRGTIVGAPFLWRTILALAVLAYVTAMYALVVYWDDPACLCDRRAWLEANGSPSLTVPARVRMEVFWWIAGCAVFCGKSEVRTRGTHCLVSLAFT